MDYLSFYLSSQNKFFRNLKKEQIACSDTNISNILQNTCMVLTGKDLMFHSTALFSGTHLAWPVVVLNLGESASLGTGTKMDTLLAVERLLN